MNDAAWRRGRLSDVLLFLSQAEDMLALIQRNESDVVLAGRWQKHRENLRELVSFARTALVYSGNDAGTLRQ